MVLLLGVRTQVRIEVGRWNFLLSSKHHTANSRSFEAQLPCAQHCLVENDFQMDSILELEPAGLSLGQAFTKKLCHAGSVIAQSTASSEQRAA